MAKCIATVKEGTLKKKGLLSRHLTKYYNHLEYNDSSILRGAFIGNHVHKALKVMCYACAYEQFLPLIYLSRTKHPDFMHIYQLAQEKLPTDLER